MNNSGMIILFILAALGIIYIVRELVCWYFKSSHIHNKLIEIDNKTERIEYQLENMVDYQRLFYIAIAEGKEKAKQEYQKLNNEKS